MKYIAALLITGLVALAYGNDSGPRLPLENVDVDDVLKNDKLVHKYIDCLLDNGRCDTSGKDLKGNFNI